MKITIDKKVKKMLVDKNSKDLTLFIRKTGGG